MIRSYGGDHVNHRDFVLGKGPEGLRWDHVYGLYTFINGSEVYGVKKLVTVGGPYSYATQNERGGYNYKMGYANTINGLVNNRKMDQNKWMRLVRDNGGAISATGAVLINKSIMVYYYCVITAQASFGGYSVAMKGLIEESFAKNVNSFTTNQPRFESKDLNTYYRYAKLHSFVSANKSIDDKLLLISSDMKLKQTESNKKVYDTGKKDSVDGVDAATIVKPAKKAVKPVEPSHVPIEPVVTDNTINYVELSVLAVVSAYTFYSIWQRY